MREATRALLEIMAFLSTMALNREGIVGADE